MIFCLKEVYLIKIHINPIFIIVAVLLFSFDDPYMSLVRKSLEEIQNKNGSNVRLIINLDSASNPHKY
jgi:hypothetical protein